MLDGSLGASDSSIQPRLQKGMQGIFQVGHWVPPPKQMNLPEEAMKRTGHLGSRDRDLRESRRVNRLGRPPAAPAKLLVCGASHLDADIVNDAPAIRAGTYTIPDVQHWRQIGPQILLAAGWRPDSAVRDGCHIPRTVPHLPHQSTLIFVGSPVAMEWLPGTCKEALADLLERHESAPSIGADYLCPPHQRITCACVRLPDKETQAQGISAGAPARNCRWSRAYISKHLHGKRMDPSRKNWRGGRGPPELSLPLRVAR